MNEIKRLLAFLRRFLQTPQKSQTQLDLLRTSK